MEYEILVLLLTIITLQLISRNMNVIVAFIFLESVLFIVTGFCYRHALDGKNVEGRESIIAWLWVS